MRIVDLTLEITFPSEVSRAEDYSIPLEIQGEKYKALCHKIHIDGMSGTYLDFPGHIVETDDGVHAGNCPLTDLFMLDTTVIRLDRHNSKREVTGEELDAANIEVKGDALIIHALGDRDCTEFDIHNIPYFGPSAIQWILGQQFRVFASDIYENKADLQGIFSELFSRGVPTVCVPVNLRQIRETYPKSCIIPARMRGIVQLPCRFFVVEGVS